MSSPAVKELQPAPPWVIWESLTKPRRAGARSWLDLLDHEIEPEILDAYEPTMVVWSSLWPDRAEDRIRFDIRPDRDDQGSSLRWTLVTAAQPPTEDRLAEIRHRINVLINERLRLSYGQ